MLIMIFISACICLLPFNVIPYDMVTGIVNEVYNHWYYSFAGLLFLIISIMLLFSGVSGKKKETRGIVKTAEYGDIKISVDTFESLSYRVVRQLSGIKDVKISVVPEEGGILVYAKLLVLPDINIPQIVSDVQNKIKEYVENITEVSVKGIKVDVENVAQVSSLRVE